MKQAEITFELKDGIATIKEFRNVLTYPEIVDAIGENNAIRYIEDGPFFFRVQGIHGEYVRVGDMKYNKEIRVGMKTKYIDHVVKTMRAAGKRLSEFVRGTTITVKI